MSNPASSSSPWQSGSKARAVQHAFTNARIRDINARAITTLFTPTLALLKASVPALRKASPEKVQAVYFHLTERLQAAELTINLKAPSWFMQPNNYDSYTQMYERAVKAGVMKLTDSDPMNPAAIRVKADDQATFPANMPTTPSAAPRRGLSPGARGLGDAGQKMSIGTLNQSGGEYTASNAQFDPRTRQIFAALNYGRRPHGSCIDYGHSYLVLNDKFKRDALYFGGDTFGVLMGKSVSAADQISYDLLGAILLKANPRLQQDLIQSCVNDGSLGDSTDPSLLLEAHLFEALKFSGGAAALNISAKDPVTQPDGTKKTPSGAQWQTIQTNARAFAGKHGLKLTFIE